MQAIIGQISTLVLPQERAVELGLGLKHPLDRQNLPDFSLESFFPSKSCVYQKSLATLLLLIQVFQIVQF
jgi:hypothetical protein